jgi:hypothetical protein
LAVERYVATFVWRATFVGVVVDFVVNASPGLLGLVVDTTD